MVRGLQSLKDATVITYIRLRAEQAWFDSPQKEILLCCFAHTKPESAKFTFDNCYVHMSISQKGNPFCPVFTKSLNGLHPNQTTMIIHFNSIQYSLFTSRINSPRANYRDSTNYVEHTQSTLRGADRSGCAVQGAGLLPFVCWDFGYESRRRHGCMFLVSDVCWRVEVTALGSSRVQRSPTEHGVSVCDREALTIRRPLPTRRQLHHAGGNKTLKGSK